MRTEFMSKGILVRRIIPLLTVYYRCLMQGGIVQTPAEFLQLPLVACGVCGQSVRPFVYFGFGVHRWLPS